MRNKDRYLIGYNSATGTTTDQTTDNVITRDPNDYVVPRVDVQVGVNFLLKIALVLAIIILIPLAIKTIKTVY